MEKERRLIDASAFDGFIMPVPEDVFDEDSYIRGVDDMLYLIRTAPVVKKEVDVIVDGKLSMHTEV